MSDGTSEERLNRLEDRIRQIEEKLGIGPVAAGPPESQQAAETQFAVQPEPAPQPEPARPIDPVLIQPPPRDVYPEIQLEEETAPRPIPFPIPIAARKQPAAPPPQPEPDARQLEHTIGLKWAGWIGAVVLVVGAALGVQYAYENHWFGRLPPVLRLGMIFAAGFALIGAGEYVFRRINQISAASLYGAGAATLFVGAYAGFGYFDLYDRNTSMALMGLSTLVGAAVAMRGNLVSIGVLSLVGADIAPLLVATANAPIVPFLLYLLAMQLVALVLSEWGKGGKWWTLRGLALVSQLFWIGGLLGGNHGHDAILLAMMVVYALLYHADLILSAIRTVKEKLAGSGMAIAVTAAFVAGVLVYYADATPAVRGAWVLGTAVLSAGLGFGLVNVHPNLRRLATAHRIAGAALLVLWIPIATSGVRVEIGWMLLAVAFALVWATTQSPIARFAAPVTWVLGLSHLAGAAMDRGAGDTWLTIWATSIGSNIILAWLFVIAGHLIAGLIFLWRKSEPDHPQWRTIAKLLATISGLLCFIASIGGLPTLGATGCIIGYAWLLLAADRMGMQPELGDMAFTALLIATIKWAAVDTLNARLSSDWIAIRPVFNPLMFVGALAAGSLIGFHQLIPGRIQRVLKSHNATDPYKSAILLSAAVIAMMTIGLSFEIDRVVSRAVDTGWQLAILPWDVRQLAWTILWSASLCALLVTVARIVGVAQRQRWMRLLWPVAGILALKFIFLDTLWPVFSGDSGSPITPVFNLDVLAGACVFGCLTIARLLLTEPTETAEQVRHRISTLATLLIGWMGTLEIARFVARMDLPPSSGLPWHFENLGWTMWWSAVAAAAIAWGWKRDRRNNHLSPRVPWLTLWPGLLAAIAFKYLLVDALGWRFAHAPVHGWLVLANLEVLAAVFVLAGLILPALLPMHPAIVAAGIPSNLRKGAATLAVPILLVCGSLEVDRAFNLPAVVAALSDPNLAEQVAISIFWSTFAVASLAVGFWRRVAPLRYFALALLAVTLLKVVVIDLSQVGYGYRVLSFIGLGILLLGTSVMYGKISPKLLAQSPPRAV